ncbi:MAG: hypothetical protein COT34_02295 [Candidatus Nealsonbacteria bacterium CG08_land_8_20_14_0_20_43_11]|uniref:DNA polymerase III subunit delta n=1 Tax=Candidatus Nealsonbacteria bacterium CG08_land_8_20_14_0_20_43_11 TaxID=1974706 RepID=A0A2M6T0K5_9BACT|nr:MAG: hypothetical protein COT34_02295 [Candidatus Nealsonbacteria bacterium CG08_land_8_20_14_0_20_43_11]
MLVGHKKQWQMLEKSWQAGRLAHAYLFVGQEKLGKKTFAIELAKEILKEEITRRPHPDYLFLEPETKEIKIEQIRDFIWKMSLKPSVAEMKVAIVDQAQMMTIEAQNCFLKTLEEPAGQALIVLITAYPHLLLPTIVSRCEQIKFFPVPVEEITKHPVLKSLAEKEIDEVLRIAMGRPGAAIDLISLPQAREKRRQIMTGLGKVLNASLAGRFAYVKEMPEAPAAVEEILNTWLWCFRRALINKLGQEKELTIFSKKSLSQLMRIISNIEETRFLALRTNVNLRLALENLLLEF